jgi:hypothetical protein
MHNQPVKHSYKIILSNGESFITSFNGTYEQARKVYVGTKYDLRGKEVKCVDIRAVSDFNIRLSNKKSDPTKIIE